MLEARHVSITFGGLKAVDDASLAVPAGSITSLIGPNGAGKSTLFGILSGFLEPDAGSRRSEEHTAELQSPCNLVCRLLLEKKNDAMRYRVWCYVPCSGPVAL